MDDLILDYSEYLEARKGSTPHGDQPVQNVQLFDRVGWCPFCSAAAPQVADEKDEWRPSLIDEHGVFGTAWQCPCGWWQTHCYDWRHDSGFYWDSYRVRNAVLRRYDPADSALPVATLRQTLLKRPDLLDKVGRYKTEELVANIFADHYNCEARNVGKSHDGGIDLILVVGDTITLVQVKHRDKESRNWRAEPVATVREFLGAFMLARGQYAILVSTARRFSRGGQAAATNALTLENVRQYDLIDGPELLRMLNLTRDRISEHWRSNLQF